MVDSVKLSWCLQLPDLIRETGNGFDRAHGSMRPPFQLAGIQSCSKSLCEFHNNQPTP